MRVLLSIWLTGFGFGLIIGSLIHLVVAITVKRFATEQRNLIGSGR